MKCQIPEISWHNRDPVLSVDIQPKITCKKGDKIWYLQTLENGVLGLECAADLARHQKAVNVVRWSPSGEYLASGDDESVILIWKLKHETEIVNICETTNEQDRETWIVTKILRGHMEDIYDLAWSPDSKSLISGSVDNTARLWNIQKNNSYAVLQDHQGFVQGVAWDPKNRYLATLSTDRSMRVYNVNNHKIISKSNKCSLPLPKSHPMFGDSVRIFHDDTLQTFFRRLNFSPDGSILVAPSGILENNNLRKPVNATYLYTRNSWKTPAVVLPSPDQFTVAIRFCPVLFKLNFYANEHQPIIPLPYRMVFAVATRSSVYLYDTQQRNPFAIISNIHYTRLTDLTWSANGLCLIVSSTDGFCSIITFDDEELGKVYCENDTCNLNKNKVDSDKENELTANSKTSVSILTKSFLEKKPIIEAGTKVLEIPADKIISVTEQFSPSKVQNKPIIPIAIRRQPREEISSIIQKPSPSKTSDKEVLAPKYKSATPIAVRKAPKTQIISISLDSKLASDNIALDLWPSVQHPTKEFEKKETDIILSPFENDSTQQICLIVDEDGCPKDYATEIDDMVKEPTKIFTLTNKGRERSNSNAKTPKTPRRVEFRTISTPKSKKKLLE